MVYGGVMQWGINVLVDMGKFYIKQIITKYIEKQVESVMRNCHWGGMEGADCWNLLLKKKNLQKVQVVVNIQELKNTEKSSARTDGGPRSRVYAR